MNTTYDGKERCAAGPHESWGLRRVLMGMASC